MYLDRYLNIVIVIKFETNSIIMNQVFGKLFLKCIFYKLHRKCYKMCNSLMLLFLEYLSWKFGQQVIIGIALPVGLDKLYYGSTDGTVRMWDCHTGHYINVINLGVEITSLINKGPWIFIGVKNAIKVSFNFSPVSLLLS